MTVPVTAATSAAFIAAAEQRRREEEEEMSMGDLGSLAGWEFKILRGCFRSQARLADALRLEAEFGWELHEKLDDARIRLRRQVEQRDLDARRGGDPYRTYQGSNPQTIALLAGLVAALTAGVVAALAVAS